MFRKIALVAAAATITASGAALAADLPSKKSVPALVADEASAIHGFMDFGYASGRLTGGGMPVYKSGASLFQSDAGVAIDLYKSKSGLINSVSVFAGGWAESWSNAPASQPHMQDYDWWAGASVGFADYYKLTVQSLQFQLPGAGVIENGTATLAYDDAHLGLPVALNPSVTVFYNFNGGLSAMPLGKTNTYRVDLAIAPGYSFQKSTGVPVSVSVPTTLSLAPKNFYYAAGSKDCGATLQLTCSTSTAELFSTGLQAKYDLGQFVPKKFGSWSLKAGVQYYHLMSDAVVANGVSHLGYSKFSQGKANFAVFSTGLGVSF